MSKRFLSGINVIGGTTLNGVTDAGVDTDKFIVLDSNGVIRYRTGDEILSDVGAVSTARTLSINGTSYDLSADRSWTISTSSSARSIQKFVATANQTTFTITGGYTVGLVDVYVNGVKLDNSGDFTATNGSTIVLTTGTLVNNIVEVYKYINAFTANNALRVSTYFTATAGQTTFAATYSLGLIDVFYNGSKLATSEYNASSGTSIVFNNACSVNDIIEIIAYNYSVGGFTGVSQTRTITINGTAYDLSADRAWTIDNASLGAQPQLNGTGLVRMAGTTVSYDNATYATQSYVTTAVANLVNSAPSTLDTLNELATALGNDANFSTTVTTSIGTKQPQLNGTGFVKISGTTISYDNSTYLTTASASSTYLPLAGGTLTGALSGTSATFSSTLTANTGTGATFRAVFDSTNIVEIGNYSVASGYQGLNIIGSPIKFYTGTPGAGGTTLALTIATNQLATFSNDILLSKSADPKISSGTNIGLNIDGTALYLNRYSQSNIVMVPNGGQVGIGDSPSYTLHVKKNANQVAGFESPNANTWIDLISTSGNWSLGASNTDTSSFGVYQRVAGGTAVNKEFLNVNSSGYLGVNLQGGSAGFQITSPDYDGYEAVTMLGSAQPTIRYAGSNRFNITSSGFYCGLRTQSSRWRYMRIEADIKSTNADHFGFFWSSDKPSSLGIGDGNVGYKWVFQPNTNSINIRDINSNGDLATSSTVPFDEKDGNWHHYVTELSHDGRVKIWVDGVLYHNRYGYNPGFGYCGISNYIGTLEVSNFTITSSETVVQDVAFFAYHNGSDVNYVPNDVLPYQNELYDYGGGYNTNGTYTAPVAGMYMFSATCNANATSSGTYSTIVPRAYWQINSANIGNSIHFRGNDLAGAATSGLTQRSATVVLYLNYGDTVRIQVQQGQYDLFGANHFCGYLLK